MKDSDYLIIANHYGFRTKNIDYFDLLQRLASRYISEGKLKNIIFLGQQDVLTGLLKLQFTLYGINDKVTRQIKYFTIEEVQDFNNLFLREQCDIFDGLIQEAFNMDQENREEKDSYE